MLDLHVDVRFLTRQTVLCALLPLWVHAQDVTTGWRNEFYRDPMHRGEHIAAAVQISDSDATDSPQVTALIRCWTASRATDARFRVSGGNVALTEQTRWRFGRGAALVGQWRVAENGQAVVVPKHIEADFLRGLRSAGELFLSPGGLPEVRFDLQGSSVAIGQVQHHCGP